MDTNVKKIRQSGPFGTFGAHAGTERSTIRHYFTSGHRDALSLDTNDRRFVTFDAKTALSITESGKAALRDYITKDFTINRILRDRPEWATDVFHMRHLNHLLDTDPMTAAGIFDRKPAMPPMRPIPWQIKVAAMQGRLA